MHRQPARNKLAALAAFAAAVLAIVASVTLAFVQATNAATAPGYSLTINPGTGYAEANWNTGTNHPSLLMAIHSSISSVTVTVTGARRDIATTQPPAMTVLGYGSGTPRLELAPEIGPDSVGNDATGYPDPSLCADPAGGICWSLGTSPNSYDATWAQVQTYIHGLGGLKTAYLVADASQPASYTAVIESFTWDGQQLVPGIQPNVLAATRACGSYSHRRWQVTSLDGPAVTFYASTRLKDGHWRRYGQPLTIQPLESVSFITTRGTTLRLGYPDGFGRWTYSQFTPAAVPCP